MSRRFANTKRRRGANEVDGRIAIGGMIRPEMGTRMARRPAAARDLRVRPAEPEEGRMVRYAIAAMLVAMLVWVAGTGAVRAQPAGVVTPPPTANAGGPYVGVTGAIVEMLGGDSTGVNLSFAWDFGDGTRGEGPVVKKVYGRAGKFTVTLTVTDPAGQSATATTTASIRVNGATSLPVTCVVPVAGNPCFFFAGPVLIPICVPVGNVLGGCVVLPR
jgi:hypothetical protein